MFGPLLFSIYINDISTISDTFIMYADDTTMYFNTEDFPKDNLAKHITTELDKVDVWLKHNKLSLNVKKMHDFSHINMVTNKLSKVIGIPNRLKHVYPQNVLLSIYHSLELWTAFMGYTCRSSFKITEKNHV